MSQKLKIGVIAREASQTIEQRLKNEAHKRGHTYDRIAFSNANLSDVAQAFTAAKLLEYDILYFRTGLGSIWALALEQYLTKHKKSAINLALAKHPYRYYKTYQALAVSALSVRVPKTVLDATDDYQTIVDALGSPFVAKADISSQGRDVHLISSPEEFAPIVATRSQKEYFYQEYIPHDYDCRVHIIGGKPVGMYKRVPATGDFRSNVSRGGSEVALDDATKEKLSSPAEQIAGLLNMDICAVDFLPRKTDGELFFVEVNLNPGWDSNDAQATGVDMSVAVIDYFEEVSELQKNNHT